SSGISKRVAETTTGAASGNWSPLAEIDVVSAAEQTIGMRAISVAMTLFWGAQAAGLWCLAARQTLSFRRGAEKCTPAACAPQSKTKHNGRIRITSFLQLESRTCLLCSGGL